MVERRIREEGAEPADRHRSSWLLLARPFGHGSDEQCERFFVRSPAKRNGARKLFSTRGGSTTGLASRTFRDDEWIVGHGVEHACAPR